MEPLKLAILIPAHNEAGTIFRVAQQAARYGDVFVVDDGSTDGTGDKARRAKARVIRSDNAGSYDRALDVGFKYIINGGEAYLGILTLDADGQHPTDAIPFFVECLMRGDDLVLGERPQGARVAEKLFGLYTSLRFGVSDPLCGMKAYSFSFAKERGHFDCRNSIGTELLMFGLSQKKRHSVVPIVVSPRVDRPRFGSFWKANVRILAALVGSWSSGV